MRDLIHALNPSHQIPGRHRIADNLLDESYNELQEEVVKELQRNVVGTLYSRSAPLFLTMVGSLPTGQNRS